MLESASVDGADGVIRDMTKMADRVDDMRPLFEGDVAVLWRKRQKAVFTSGRLSPLSPESIKRKRVNKTTPLVDTGELRDVTFKYTPVKTTPLSAVFGIPKGSGSITGRGRKSIGAMHAVRSGSRPRRDAVPGWSGAERLQLLDMFSDYIMGRR